MVSTGSKISYKGKIGLCSGMSSGFKVKVSCVKKQLYSWEFSILETLHDQKGFQVVYSEDHLVKIFGRKKNHETDHIA